MKTIIMKTIIKPILLSLVLLAGAFTAQAQVKIGSSPTVIDLNSNLEIESTDPLKKISVHKITGKLTIADGSQAADRVLTSDANGVATWKAQSSLVVSARNPNTIPLSAMGVSYYPQIPFVSGNASTWNSSTGEFTAPADGFYEYNFSLEVVGVLGQLFSINVTPLALEDGPIRGSTGTWNSRTVSGVKYLLTGQKLTPQIFIGGGIAFDSNWSVKNLAAVVFKVN